VTPSEIEPATFQFVAQCLNGSKRIIFKIGVRERKRLQSSEVDVLVLHIEDIKDKVSLAVPMFRFLMLNNIRMQRNTIYNTYRRACR
jgi:hypothetical protein